MDDLKLNWTQEELVELITESCLLGKTDFAGKCKVCAEDRPVIIRYRGDIGIITCCPECALDLAETRQFELDEQKRQREEAHRQWQAMVKNQSQWP